MKKKILAFEPISASFCFTPATADMNRTMKGALLGAGVGLFTGSGVNGALKDAAVGAGAGAITGKGRNGKNARRGVKTDAAVDVVTGVLTGDSLEGAIKGAVIGSTGGVILGKTKQGMMMKKFALLAGPLAFAPMTWARDYNIKNGLPSETYITHTEVNEMARTDGVQVAEIVAVIDSASVANCDLKTRQSPELSAKMIEKLNQVYAKDP